MSKFREKLKNEDGEIMLEALIVYSVTIMLLFLILAIFSLFYQRWNIQVIANEAATKVGQNYRYLLATGGVDEYSGAVADKSAVTAISEYRYLFSDKVEATAVTVATDHAKNRLAHTSYVKNVDGPNVSVEVVNDSLARKHVEVTLSGSYKVPLGEIFSFFGMKDVIEYKTVGYADCVDIINYMNTVDFTDNLLNKNVLGSELYKSINMIIGLIDSIRNLLSH